MVKKILSNIFPIMLLLLSILSLGINNTIPVSANSTDLVPSLAPLLPTPPPNFNPLTAASDELAMYGFPQKPTDSEQLKVWEYAMSRAIHYVKPEQHPSNSVHGLVSTVYSNSQTGYIVMAANNKSGYTPAYVNASGSWIQPVYDTGNANPSFWNGIGGFGSGSIVQAGADSNALSMGGTTRYEFWVEDYPNNTIWEAQPVVHGGNQLYVSTSKMSGNLAQAFLQNQTTGNYTIVSFYCPYYSGSSAEFIHEAAGNPIRYGSWGQTTFSVSWVGWLDNLGNSHSAQLGSLNYNKMIMTDNGHSDGNVKAYPSDISNNTFTITSTS